MLFRSVFLPTLVPLVAAALGWTWMFNAENGPINAAIALLERHSKRLDPRSDAGLLLSKLREASKQQVKAALAEAARAIAAGDFDLAGFTVGVVELRRAIDPMRVEGGDVVIGLASDGVHLLLQDLQTNELVMFGWDQGTLYRVPVSQGTVSAALLP